MPVQMKTPGVYIVEKNAFPPSIVAVETAVPAFVGYTERAEFKGKKLTNVPFKVTSMTEFETAFGGAPKPRFRIDGPNSVAGSPALMELSGAPDYLALPDGGTAKAKGLTAEQIAAVAERLGKVTLDTAVENNLKGLKAGVPLTDPQVVVLTTLATTPLSSVPALPKPHLDATQFALLTGAPAGTGGKLSAEEVAAIQAAVGVGTLTADQAAPLAGIAADSALATPQKNALKALLETFADEPLEDDGAAPSRSTGVKIGSHVWQVVRDDDQSKQYQLWYAMRMFFDNGGGPCWIVSVGSYGSEISDKDLKSGIEKYKDGVEPTIVGIPHAIKLPEVGTCIAVQQAMLKHCGDEMKNRFAILDIYDGDQPQQPDDPVAQFRNLLGVNNLNFGAAYYPWLNTVVTQDRDVTFLNFLADDADKLSASVDQLMLAVTPPSDEGQWFWNRINVPSLADSKVKQSIREFMQTKLTKPYEELEPEQQTTIDQINSLLVETTPAFKQLRAEAIRQLNVLPPSGAMAGLYTFVDNNRGVWKAPANVSVNNAVSPCVPISDYLQRDLNVTPMGKSINAIRSFIGEGVLVWGARTLDGNSQDWRYVNVRRTMIFLEESCRLAAKRMVFEPNVSSTWVTIKAMIENFLHSVWRQGALAGAVPTDAYSVHVGLGDTMTADDILEGILRVTVLVAISRPAEFIEITFQQQLQKS